MRALAVAMLLAGCTASDNTDVDLDELMAGSTNCGVIRYDNLGDDCGLDRVQAALSCFENNDAPRISVESTTIEGGIIYDHFFIDEDGAILAVHDNRDDEFGDQSVSSQICSSLAITGSCPRISCIE